VYNRRKFLLIFNFAKQMKTYTQEEIVMKYLKNECMGQWVFGYQLIGKNTRYGFMGSSIERACRRLAEKGLLERRRVKRFAQFRIRN